MAITLQQAIHGFTVSNQAEGLSPRTIKWHQSNLGYFYDWATRNHSGEILLDEIKSSDIRGFLNELRGAHTAYTSHPFRSPRKEGLKPRTIQAYFSSVSAFFNWALREEMIERSPTNNIPRPKSPKYLPDPFTEDEIKIMFLSVAEKFSDKKAARILAIMAILLDTGARMSELLGITLEDLLIEQGRIKLLGKGSKERFVFIGKTTKTYVWKYLSFHRPEPSFNIDNLFLTNEGLPIPSRRLGHMLAEVGKISGVPNVHPHRWRRTAAIQFLRNSNGNLLGLQKMLGHESLEMVRRYLLIADEDLQIAHKIASPVDNLKLARRNPKLR